MKSRKNTESKNPKVVKSKNGRIMLLSKCAVCNSKKSKFPKEQEARGLLSFGIRTTSSQIPLLGKRYKTNEILNKFLLAGDKFMPEIDLKQPGFTCSLCGPFTKNKE